jgi:hypothetical protein
MPKSYTVDIQAVALRTVRVVANNPREALDKVSARIKQKYGAWTIDFPGGYDEHWSVWESAKVPGEPDTWLGPGPDGLMEGEEVNDDTCGPSVQS